MAKSTSTREDRAAQILAAGLVTLRFDGTATVRGSGKAEYTVSRESCTCPDFVRRNLDCKHRIAVRSLCKLYRALRAQAQETGKARLPYLLGLALRGQATSPAPVAVPVLTCGDCGTVIQRGRHCLDCLDRDLGFSVAA